MRVTLVTWQALGDTLVSLPVAFHLESQGHEVAILNTQGNGQVLRRQCADLLPTYPRFASCQWGRSIHLGRDGRPENGETGRLPVGYGRVFDLTAGKRFAWFADMDLCEDIAGNAGLKLGDAPHFPLLAKPPEYVGRAAELTGSTDPFVLVAPEGSHPDRHLTQEQVAAVTDTTRTVVVHHVPHDYPCDVNLTGKTSIADLCALAAMASAVVSVDTGTWHLAPAFLTPTLGIVGQTSNPHSLNYRPAVYLQNATSEQAVPPARIAETLETLLLTRPLSETRLPANGVRWWETSEVRSRLATAERHQRNLERTFGCRVQEVG